MQRSIRFVIYYNYSPANGNTFMPTAQKMLFFCILEAKEGVTISNLQDHVDASDDIK